MRLCACSLGVYKINGLRIFPVHFCSTFTRLKSLVRTLYQEATGRRGFPSRRRIKKKKKKRKSMWNTQKYMHTKNQASGYLLIVLLQNQMPLRGPCFLAVFNKRLYFQGDAERLRRKGEKGEGWITSSFPFHP